MLGFGVSAICSFAVLMFEVTVFYFDNVEASRYRSHYSKEVDDVYFSKI